MSGVGTEPMLRRRRSFGTGFGVLLAVNRSFCIYFYTLFLNPIAH
jgi:hypothetical protein